MDILKSKLLDDLIGKGKLPEMTVKISTESLKQVFLVIVLSAVIIILIHKLVK